MTRDKLSKEQRGYVQSVVLRYIADHPDIDKRGDYPAYYQHELKISDSRIYVKKLEKKGLLQRNTAGERVLTERGRQSIEEDCIRFFDFAGPYVSFADYAAERDRLGGKESFEIVMLSILLKKIKVMKERNDYEEVKNIHRDIAAMYEELGIADRAMYHYLVALFYDVSGLDYYDQLARYVRGKQSRKMTEEAFFGICICPQVSLGIHRLKDAYEPGMVREIYQKETIVINLCSQNNFERLVKELCEATFNYSVWRARFAVTYCSMLDAVDKHQTH